MLLFTFRYSTYKLIFGEFDDADDFNLQARFAREHSCVHS